MKINAPKLIGITGKARSGKDTLASYLSTKHGVERYAFAWPLKRGLRAMFDLDGRHTDGLLKETPIIELGGKSPREMMQTLGTEWGREFVSRSIWVDLGLARWSQYKSEGKSLAITDVRFENEATAIREAGGVIVHVRRGDAEAIKAHPSEAGVERQGGDLTIANDGNFEDFFEAADLELMPLICPEGFK